MAQTRVKPTDKYREYQAKINAHYTYIIAQLNDKLEYLEPLTFKDRLSNNRSKTVTQCFLMHDWAGEVQVYHIVQYAPDVPGTSKHFHWVGTLPDAIKSMIDACKYLDNDDRQVYFARIKQLEDLRKFRFDDEGRKRLC